MARQESEQHFQMHETPFHTEDQWIFQPYGVPGFTESTRQLVPRLSEADSDGPYASRQAHFPHSTSIVSSQSNTDTLGYYPGCPGPAISLAGPQATYDGTSFKPFVPGFTTPSLPAPSPVYSHKHNRQDPPCGPPPDGGVVAWLQVVGGYFLFFNTWGLINAFGVFQTYYKDELLPSKTNSTIAWIGTLTSFLLCASPISWGPIFDIGSPRLLVFVGSFSVVLGLMMTSLCDQYWQLMMAQGICCGFGGGALFITATSVLPSYFSRKRALAMGISASGSSLGGIIYPIMFRYAQPAIGFGWAVRIIGFTALLTLAIPCAVIKPRSKPQGRRKIFDTRILGEIPFACMNVATFFGFVGQYIPYFFIEQFAGEHGLSLRFWMLIFLNAGSIPGRIGPSLLADRCFHPLKVLATTTSAATLLAFCWVAIRHSTAGLVVWSLLYGFCSGAFVSLQGAAVASMTRDLRSIGTRFGINMFAGALGILIGSPVGGAIFPESWPGAQVFCGASLLCATLAIVGTYVAFRRSEEGKALA